MAISNETKRKLTCPFCPKKNGCKRQCKKYWKGIYLEHRDKILDIYHSNSKQSS